MYTFIYYICTSARHGCSNEKKCLKNITQVAVSSKSNEWKWKSYISNADRSKKISKKTWKMMKKENFQKRIFNIECTCFACYNNAEIENPVLT